MPLQPTDTPKTDQIELTEPTSARAEVLARLLSQVDSKTTELGELRAWREIATSMIQELHERLAGQATKAVNPTKSERIQAWGRGRRVQAQLDADWLLTIAALLRIELKV